MNKKLVILLKYNKNYNQKGNKILMKMNATLKMKLMITKFPNNKLNQHIQTMKFQMNLKKKQKNSNNIIHNHHC